MIGKIIGQGEGYDPRGGGHIDHSGGSIDLVNVSLVYTGRVETLFNYRYRAVAGLGLRELLVRDFCRNLEGP